MNFQTLFNNTTTKRDTLKPAFNVGEIPTQQHFYDMIDGLFLQDDTVYKDANNGLAIQAGTDANKTALLLYADATSEPAWQLGIANGFELKDTAGNTQLMVTNDGKVGVGTTSPATKLSVVQEAPGIVLSAETTTLAGTAGYTGLSIKAKDESNTTSEWILYNSIANGYNGIGFFDPAASSYRLFIDKGNGKVGIGTTNPTVSLDILAPAVGGNEYMLQMKVSDAPSDYMKLGNVTAVPGQFIPAIVAHHDTDNRAALYLISSISPSSNNGTNPVMYFEARTAESPHTLPTSSTRPMFGWGSYNATKMVMMANGNVGIGTTNPSATLHVVGNSFMNSLDIANSRNTNGTNDGIAINPNNNFNYIELTHDNWGGTHGLLFNCYKNANNGGLYSPGNLNHANDAGAYSSGAGAVVFEANGGNMYFLISGNSSGKNSYVDWQGSVLTLERSGDAHFKRNVYASNFPLSSDARFKKNITPITTDSITKLSRLQGNHYQWRTKEFEEKNFSEGTQLGFIAQDMQKVFPELVHEDKDGYLSINYTGLIPVLTEAHKQQQKTIESQQTQIDNLVERMVALENLLAIAKN